ncbi:MAG: thioredoxin fold domain-containing protein [Phycisphaerales bacterium]|nr:thioredoxin fold domain-containing protein [Phycisphaerales bacterium]
MAHRIIALTAFFITSFAVAETPFEDISYPAAVRKAQAESKVVMIDFYTTWCPPCKMLDSRTWPNADVQKWLAKHAVSIKVDAEASKEFADRFKVRAYPTIVFVRPDGTVLDRLVGFHNPTNFIEAAEGVLSGKDAIARAREAFQAGDMNDPSRRDDFARKLVDYGDFQEALKHYLWCFDHGEQYQRSYSGVRVSFLLSNIKNLADTYPPAMAALKDRRDACEKKIRDFVAGEKLERKKSKEKGLLGFLGRVGGIELPPIFDVTGDLAALNNTLGDGARTINVYDELKACDRKASGTARKAMFHWIADDLLEARRYKDYVEDGDPVHSCTLQFEVFEFTKSQLGGEDKDTMKMVLEHTRTSAISDAGSGYEACVGANRLDLANQIKDGLIGFEASFFAFDTLISGAVRAGRFDLLQALSDEAQTKLGAEDASRIAASVNDYLATPEAKAALMKHRQQPGPVADVASEEPGDAP